MSINIEELQVEIDGVVFGAGTDSTLATIKGLGNGTLRDRVLDRANGDGEDYGREYRNARPLEFIGQVARPGNPTAAWDRSGQLEAMFDAAGVRLEARKVMACRFRRPGQAARVTYGRADGYEPDVTMQAVGLIGFEAAFRRTDPLWYGDTLRSTRVKLATQSTGHIILNGAGRLTGPIRTTEALPRSSYVTNDGNAPTWPVVRIGGPVANPKVTLVNSDGVPLWTLAVNATIAAGTEAVIDTRPWARSAALASGAPLPGPLTNASIPSQSTIPPGAHEVVCSGVDPSGLAYFEVEWRDAYRNL